MKVHDFAITVTWIATVTAALESDSHGNWGNEKNVLKQTYTPKMIDRESKENIAAAADHLTNTGNPLEKFFNFSNDDKSIQKKKEGTLEVNFVNKDKKHHELKESRQHISKQVVQSYILPLNSKVNETDAITPYESVKNDNISKSTTNQNANNETALVDHISFQDIPVPDARYILTQKNSSNDFGQLILEGNLDIGSAADFGQRVRYSSSFTQRSKPKEIFFASSVSEDYGKNDRKSFPFHTQQKFNNTKTISNTSEKTRLLPFTLVKTIDLEETAKQKGREGSYTENVSVKGTSSAILGSVIPVSLGKFSGPIVVPDLPRQKKYPYNTVMNYSERDEALTEATTSKVSENSYIAASPVVLNPLQVGVALMNAEQDLHLIYGNTDLVQIIKNENNESLIQNDTPDFTNSSYPIDQISQQEQISEVVTSNLSTPSVEIQKSVEIFHTAPIQEIHYPAEFIPYVQQPLVKQKFREGYRKPSKTQFKDQRLNQVNIYKSNEIVDENIISNNPDIDRYEYSTNKSRDVINHSISILRSPENKHTVRAKEQPDNTKYDQTAIIHSTVQEIPDYDSRKTSSSTISQSTKLTDSLSSLVNLDSFQSIHEVPQILLSKGTNDVPSELRLLTPILQSYPLDKTPYLSQTIDIGEKKVPFPEEKIMEKQRTVPQSFPVYIPEEKVVEKQIRIPFPIHAEKKVPFPIQRFIIPIPIHFRIPQKVSIPGEKGGDKSLPISVGVEKNLPRPYPSEAEKSRTYSFEIAKHIKTSPIYNIQTDTNYQQKLIRQNFQAPLGHLYGTENEQNYYNSTGQFYGSSYLTSNRPIVRQSAIHTLPKKFGSYTNQYLHPASYPLNGNNGNYGRIMPVEKDKITDEYVGPVPRIMQQNPLGIQSKSMYSSSDIQATLRRTRQEMGNTGSFRQSKMEYGFKPPMVPSVQYDEQTASKIN